MQQLQNNAPGPFQKFMLNNIISFKNHADSKVQAGQEKNCPRPRNDFVEDANANSNLK